MKWNLKRRVKAYICMPGYNFPLFTQIYIVTKHDQIIEVILQFNSMPSARIIVELRGN